MNAESLLSKEEILAAVDGVYVLGNGDVHFTNVQTDSRNVERETLFVPLIGEVQDGHIYVPQALEKGASVVFIAKDNFEKDSGFFVDAWKKFPDTAFIAVDNTMTALQKAAGRYVEKFPSLIKIGVTGSSGKTTTKEILASIMARKYSVITNKGNLNSETGLPLSVFNIRSGHQCGIFEMGMNRKDEIAEICAVLKPNYALVTNIGTAHIGNLGSRENIAAEKSHVFDWLKGDGIGVIPDDDDFTGFMEKLVKGTVLRYGADTESVRFVKDLGFKGTEFSVCGKRCVLSLPGKYNYRNALGAIALAEALGVSPDEIVAGIESLEPMFGRSRLIEGKFNILQDCYNANPDSMEKSIEFFSSVDSDKPRFYVLGDMLELGGASESEHRKVGMQVSASGSENDFAFFFGAEMRFAFEECTLQNKHYIDDKSDEGIRKIAGLIEENASEKALVLVKGSRGMRLERLTDLISGS